MYFTKACAIVIHLPLKYDAQSPTIFLVLGVHRSGTSVITRSLEAFNIDLGAELLGPAADNAKGFFEDKAIVDLDQTLLRLAGGAWDRPWHVDTDLLRRLSTSKYGKAASIVVRSKLRKSSRVGFKDPRMCILLPFWIPVLQTLDVPVYCIIALRHPLSVAKSLRRRNHLAISVGVRLWSTYMLEAVANAAALWPCSIVEYEALLGDPESELNRMAVLFGCGLNGTNVEAFIASFLDGGLCHDYRKSVVALREVGRGDSSLMEIYGLLKRGALLKSAVSEELYTQICAIRMARARHKLKWSEE
jgi:hypothetical protein